MAQNTWRKIWPWRPFKRPIFQKRHILQNNPEISGSHMSQLLKNLSLFAIFFRPSAQCWSVYIHLETQSFHKKWILFMCQIESYHAEPASHGLNPLKLRAKLNLLSIKLWASGIVHPWPMSWLKQYYRLNRQLCLCEGPQRPRLLAQHLHHPHRPLH